MKGVELNRALALGAHHDAVLRELQVRHRDRVLVVLPFMYLFTYPIYLSVILSIWPFIQLYHWCECGMFTQCVFVSWCKGGIFIYLKCSDNILKVLKVSGSGLLRTLEVRHRYRVLVVLPLYCLFVYFMCCLCLFHFLYSSYLFIHSFIVSVYFIHYFMHFYLIHSHIFFIIFFIHSLWPFM